jgi:hypothetical protein
MSWQENRQRVQEYNEELGKLEKSHRNKVEKIIENHCLQELSQGQWICKPIVGYNSTTHRLDLIPIAGKYSCSCQGHRSHGRCSHVDALVIVLRLRGEKLQPSLF